MDKPIIFGYHTAYQYTVLANTLKTVYPTSFYWDGSSIFDFLYINKPKYFFGSLDIFTTEVTAALKKFNIPVIIYGVAVPPELTGLVRLVIVPSETPKVIQKNINCDNKYVLEPSANIISINNPIYDGNKQLDVVAIELEPFTKEQLNTLASVDNKYKYRVYLNSISYLPNYAGHLSKNHGSYIYNSKATIDFNNVIKYDVAFNKGFCFTNKKDEFYPNFTNSEDINILIETCLKTKIDDNRKIAYNNTVESHTCFHRLSDVLKLLKEDDLASKSIESINKYIW